MLLGGQFQKAMATCSRVGGPHQVHRPTTHARHHFCCHLLSIIASRWPGRTSSRAGAPGKSPYGPTETMGFEEVVIWTTPGSARGRATSSPRRRRPRTGCATALRGGPSCGRTCGPNYKLVQIAACADIIIILWPHLFEMTYNPNEAWR